MECGDRPSSFSSSKLRVILSDNQTNAEINWYISVNLPAPELTARVKVKAKVKNRVRVRIRVN